MRFSRWVLAAVYGGLAPFAARAATIYSDDFNSNTAANYSVFTTKTAATGGIATSDATFAYDYSALGIPVAPHTTDNTTVGLRLRTDNLGNTGDGSILGYVSVVSKSISGLSAPYTVTADVWGNYIGGTSLAASGSNGTTGALLGIGTAGTSAQTPLGNDGFIVDAFHDGGNSAASNSDYRVYVDNTSRPTSLTSNYFAAGTGSASEDNTDPYYAFLGTHTAPTAQTTSNPTTQGGTTPVGIIGFAWHTFTITQDGTNVTWAIDGTTIATVPDTALTFGGSNVSLSAVDSATGGNTAAANQLLNADIWDNLTVVSTPEPSSLALLGLTGAGMLARRRRRLA